MTTIPTVNAGELPWLSVDQMIEADGLAIEEFDIGLLQMMEHAGSGLAELVMLTAPSGRITVLAGGGNNGGGGLCAARHLINRGRDVDIVMATDAPRPAAAHHLRTLAEMGVNPRPEPGYTPVVVDALVGYGLQGPLRGRAAELARWAAMNHFVVSLDFPSGMGFDGGLEADVTLTLALPKEGLRGLRPLFVADLGLPAALWQRMGLDVGPIFAAGRVVRVEDGPAA
jgi:NAD(P)H-hydrate epimerase